MIKSVVFVCTGNTCRSAMAEAMFKKMLLEKNLNDIQVKSRGIAASSQLQVPETVRRLMLEENIDITRHKAEKLTEKDVEEAGLILVMETWQGVDIVQRFPQAESKTFLLKKYVEESEQRAQNSELSMDLEIYDPIGQSPEVYRFCKEEIKKCLEKLLAQIATDKRPD